MSPKDLLNIHPWSSVYKHSEDESTMAFIISKMAAKSNYWGITYTQYKEIYPETKLDEKRFKKYEKYLKSEDTIRLFSPAYDI